MDIQNIKQKIFNKKTLKLLIENLFILLGIIIFVILFSNIFGVENQLIGVGLITGLLLFKDIGIGIVRKEAAFVIILICFVMAICNILSFYNIYLAIFLNAFAILFLMLFSTVKVYYKTYIPFILMYIFAQDIDIPEGRVIYRFLAFFISGILMGLCHYIYNKNDEDAKKFIQIVKEIKFEKNTYIFIIKMVIGLTVAMFFADIMGIQKGMWIVITVMSLTQPNLEETHYRMKSRVKGTLIGLILYLILFKFIVPISFIPIVMFFISYIYCFIKNYYIKIIFITINSLNAASSIFNTYDSILLRISFIIFGTLIAFVIIFLEHKFLDSKLEKQDLPQ